MVVFVPIQAQRRFHLSIRNCEFYADRAVGRDVRRTLEFWINPALVHVAWDSGWNRCKHPLGTKIEVEGVFVASRRYEKRAGDRKLVDWETGLPSPQGAPRTGKNFRRQGSCPVLGGRDN